MEDQIRRSSPTQRSRFVALAALFLLVCLCLIWATTLAAQAPVDSDADGTDDNYDNCIEAFNPAQEDSDCDGYGNRCDADYDNNGMVNGADYLVFRSHLGSESGDPDFNPATDHDANGVVDGSDFLIFRERLKNPVGPAASVPRKAFPGAEGFGAFASGGRCGQVLKVTNLYDSGPGSLRWALEDVDVPRTVLFDIGGIIDLQSAIEINSRFVTVAGQTAPGGGITLRGARLHVSASNVIVRSLRVRPGDGLGDPGDERDGISVGTSHSAVERVIVDHCSLTWATDENAATFYTVKDVTFSNNIIAEGLRNSIHPEGPHSMGLFLGANSERISVLKNLLAHNVARNPLIKQGLSTEIINNYVYNYRTDGVQVSDGSSPSTVHIIGNHYEAGVDSIIRPPVYLSSVNSDYYLQGNIGIGRPTNSGPEESVAHGDGIGQIQSNPLFTASNVQVLDVANVEAHVTTEAGARWPTRDAVDQRIVSDSILGAGAAIDSPIDVGGYPAVAAGVPADDPDGDGMPTWFEVEFGFDPATHDANGDSDGDGYTNLEEYINGIVSGFSVGGS